MIFLIFLNLLCLVSQKEVTHWSPGSRRLCRCRRFAACWSSLSGSWSAVWWRCPVSWCPPPPQGYWAGSWGLLLQLQGSIWKSTGEYLIHTLSQSGFNKHINDSLFYLWFYLIYIWLQILKKRIKGLANAFMYKNVKNSTKIIIHAKTCMCLEMHFLQP